MTFQSICDYKATDFLKITVPYNGKKCPYSEFLRSVISRIRTEDGEIRSISPYSVQMRENKDRKNFEYRQFSRSVNFLYSGPLSFS